MGSRGARLTTDRHDFADPLVHTPTGIVVLGYRECAALMRDRRLRRGMSSTLAKWGVETGPFAQWMRGQLLDLEGEPHHRLRGLVSGAFGQRRIAALEPLMRAKTHELVDRLTAHAPAGVGRCEFMAVFADPYDGPVTSRPSIGITGPITLPLRFTPVSAHRT